MAAILKNYILIVEVKLINGLVFDVYYCDLWCALVVWAVIHSLFEMECEWIVGSVHFSFDPNFSERSGLLYILKLRLHNE